MACASFRQFHHLTFFLNSSSSYSYRSGPRRLPIPTIVRSPSRIRASSAVQSDSATKEDTGLKIDLFSCPICLEPLLRKGPPGLNLPAIYRSAFKCQKCNKSYSSKDFYLDLTVTSGTETYTEFKPARTELFSLKDFWNTNTLQAPTYISLQEVYKKLTSLSP